jgi:hypothetical protein
VTSDYCCVAFVERVCVMFLFVVGELNFGPTSKNLREKKIQELFHMKFQRSWTLNFHRRFAVWPGRPLSHCDTSSKKQDELWYVRTDVKTYVNNARAETLFFQFLV